MELFDAKHQAFAGIGLEFSWVAVYCILPTLAKYIYSWRILQAVVSAVCAVWIIYIWIIPESPDWLFSTKRYDDAEAALKKMAKWNGVPAPTLTLKREEKVEEEVKVPISDMFLDPKIRRHICITGGLWFANCIVYYGLLLSTPTMAGNRFLNFFLMGLVEIPSYAISLVLIDRMGRRPLIVIFHVLAGLPLPIITLIPVTTASGIDLTPLLTVLALISKFGISGSFACIVLYTKEMYPTSHRATGYNMATLVGSVANMIAPFMAYLGKSIPWLPNIIFAAISILAGLGVLLGPETRNKPVAVNLDDIYTIFYPGDKRKRTTIDTEEKKGLAEVVRATESVI